MTDLESAAIYSADQENDMTYREIICEGRMEVLRIDTQNGFGEVEKFPAEHDSKAATQS